MRAHAHQVVQNAGDLGKHHADVLAAQRHFDAEQTLNGNAIGLLVAHHRHIIQPVHIRQCLQIGAGFRQFFGAAVQEADVRVGADNGFAFQLQNHAQHAVCCRVLRAEVDGVIA